jgi:hypothetical protein
MAKTRKTTKPTTEPTVQNDALAAKEIELRAKYGDHIIPGSIHRDFEGPHAGRNTVEITCDYPGCKATRRVATSDLFQVNKCTVCTKLARNQARREKAEAKKAKPAKRTRKTTKTTKGE